MLITTAKCNKDNNRKDPKHNGSKEENSYNEHIGIIISMLNRHNFIFIDKSKHNKSQITKYCQQVMKNEVEKLRRLSKS